MNKKTNGARPETLQRIERWRQMAASLATKTPSVSAVQIARTIQRSAAGKRKGGILPYSISAILKYIREAAEPSMDPGPK